MLREFGIGPQLIINQLNVCDGDKILAHGGLHSKISVFFRDLALNQVRMNCTKAFTIKELLTFYADRTRNNLSEVTFTFNGMSLSPENNGIIDDVWFFSPLTHYLLM